MSDLGLIITDTTLIGEGPRGALARNYDEVPHASMPYAGPMDFPVMSRKEIVERVKMAEADKATLRGMCADAGLTPMFQGQTNYCWCNGPVHAQEVVRVIQGQPLIRLSAASVGGPITGYQNVGGYGIRAVKQLVEVGAAPISMWPSNEITDKWETPEVAQARPMFQIKEWYDAVTTHRMDAEERFLRQATLVMMKKPCSSAFNWMRHLITPIDMVILPNTKDELGVFCHNSGYGRDKNGFTTLTGTRAVPDECLAVRSVTASLGA